MDITYDDWGRTVTRQMAGHTSAFDYRYGDKLKSIASDFPDGAETTTFEYDGLGKMRQFQSGNDSPLWLRWDTGWRMLGLYGAGESTWEVGDLALRYTHDPASTGGSPLGVSGGEMFVSMERDRLGSFRTARLGGDAVSEREYTPYGGDYTDTGAFLLYGFTGHLFGTGNDPLYYAPYRNYSPTHARWLTRDPLGMIDGPNVYAYVKGNPAFSMDPFGLWYLDVNITGVPLLFGLTGGFMIDMDGFFPYLGVAGGPPGASVSLSLSFQDPSTGINWAGCGAGMGLYSQMGEDSAEEIFWELGGGIGVSPLGPVSASGAIFYAWDPISWDSAQDAAETVVDIALSILSFVIGGGDAW